jgi:hypothetical protein
MDAEVKERWVAALRSGQYTQATGKLRTDSGFCCLGVLCDIYDGEEWTTHSDIDDDGNEMETESWYYLDSNLDVLPYKVTQWAELESDNPKVESKGCESIAEINDSGSTFAEIADLIELNF